MTDNETMKALECCSTSYCNDYKCPLYRNMLNTKDCVTVLSANSLNLINRQKSKIEELEVEKLHLTEFLAESERKVKDLEVEIKAMRGAADCRDINQQV